MFYLKAATKVRIVGRLNALLLLLLLLLISLSSTPLCDARTSSVLKVKLPHGGVLVGRHMTSHSGRHVRGFLGVPYALPPVGELRFKSPAPYPAWCGEKLAVQDAPICLQRDPFRRDMELEGSEDCLYINVYTPEQPRINGSLPVMVWFHGGGWECGAGVSTFYGPDFLMDHDIVYVAANFRLGPLGFLSTETTDCPGNFGLKDQLEVLKWVQRNIAAFNGDPQSVTIFGESAGGASVTYHMLSPKSKDLFHKGISQSGTYFNPWAQPAHKGVAARRALKLAQLVGCDHRGDVIKTLACLRQKPAEEIVAALYDLFEWDFDPMIPFPPVVEPEHPDAFLTVLPREAGAPHGLRLPLLIGATSEEGALKTAPLLNLPGLLDEFKMKFDAVLPIVLNYDQHSPAVQYDITQKIEDFYFKQGHVYNKQNHQNLTNMMTDGWFVAGIDEYLRMRMRYAQEEDVDVGPTYAYLFDHKGAASFTEIFKGGPEDYYGACHAEELQYLFPIGQTLFVTAAPTKQDLLLREALLSMWVNFANSSNPTPASSDLPAWQPTQSYPVSYVRIGDKDEDNWTLLRNDHALLQERVDFWDQLKPHLPSSQKIHEEL